VQELLWTDVQRRTAAAAQTAAQAAAGTAHAVFAWSAGLIGAPFGAGHRGPEAAPPDGSPPAAGGSAGPGTRP
jgi:hypothetical protein